MAESINIGGRLHSTATGNVVAGANEIQDDALNKKQSKINNDVNNTLIAHESIIQGLNSQNYESYSATDETTSIDDILPDLGVVNTIYRLGNWDGNQYDPTQYSEYAWKNTGIDQGEYVLLDVKNYGIDDEPTSGSDSLVKSGGVYNAIESHSSFSAVDEDGFHVADENLNVGMRYDEDGLDVAKVSSHFVEVLKASGISADDVMASHAFLTNEDGFFITDEELNIGVKVDSDGINAKNILEYEIVED